MYANLNGITIHYRQQGAGAHAVLCFHGWDMSGDSWLPLAARFPLGQWRVVMPDLRGFGQSDKPLTGYHIDDYIQDAIRLMRHLQLKSVDVLGHSFGGTGALYLAARLPHLVRRLIVFDTIPGAAHPSVDERVRTQFQRIKTLAERAHDATLPTLLSRVWRQSLVIPPDDEQIAAQAEASRRFERHAVLATLDTILTTDIGEWLHRLKVPTLVVRGEKDPLLQNSRDGLENLASVQRVIIPDTGHHPLIESPDAVWEHVRHFLGISD